LDATTLPNGRGSIVFDGEDDEMSLRERRFWVLENAGTMRFKLKNNDLQPDSRITISGFKNIKPSETKKENKTHFLNEVYIK